MVVELDELAEAQLKKEAESLGVNPSDLAAEWLRSAMEKRTASEIPPNPILSSERRAAIEKLLAESNGRTLSLEEAGLSFREFAQLDADLVCRLRGIDPATYARRQDAAKELSTFAKDRNILLPADVTIRELIEEGRR